MRYEWKVDLRVALTIGLARKAPPYVEALTGAGLACEVLLPDCGVASLDGFAGLVLGGGSDIHPKHYGQEIAGTHDPHEGRDLLEMRLYAEAIERGLPVFGICRGLQLMNVAAGGSLFQDIGESHHKVDHPVEIDRGSRIREAAGTAGYEVVSRHHQAIDRLGGGLKITARAADGVIEGIEMEDREFVLAVQWHPEDGVGRSEADRSLFRAFARAVRGKAGRI